MGTIVVVGPAALWERDTVYRYIVIREQDGELRDFTMVRAAPNIAKVVERNATGIFLFWETHDDCRLCYLFREDKPCQMDAEALRSYLRKPLN